MEHSFTIVIDADLFSERVGIFRIINKTNGSIELILFRHNDEWKVELSTTPEFRYYNGSLEIIENRDLVLGERH